MKHRLVWDEAKRLANLDKHGLDFVDALGSPYRLDVKATRGGERRTHSLAYVYDVLAVLSLAYTERAGEYRVISFRRASQDEREAYHAWLENDFQD